eukprot:320439-Pyramimonas_sp.AAC.1
MVRMYKFLAMQIDEVSSESSVLTRSNKTSLSMTIAQIPQHGIRIARTHNLQRKHNVKLSQCDPT